MRFTSRVSKVSVEVLASEGAIVHPEDIKIIAEIPEKISGPTWIKLKSELPEGLHLLQIRPQSIKVWER